MDQIPNTIQIYDEITIQIKERKEKKKGVKKSSIVYS